MKPLSASLKRELIANLTLGYSSRVLWILRNQGLSTHEADAVYRELSVEAADEISTDRERSKVEQVFITLVFQLTMVMICCGCYLVQEGLQRNHVTTDCLATRCLTLDALIIFLWILLVSCAGLAFYAFKGYPRAGKN